MYTLSLETLQYAFNPLDIQYWYHAEWAIVPRRFRLLVVSSCDNCGECRGVIVSADARCVPDTVVTPLCKIQKLQASSAYNTVM